MNATEQTTETGAEQALPRAPVIVDKSFYSVFDALKWVSEARSTDDTRFSMCGVSVESDGRVIATDGRRLHKLENMPAWAPGFYTVTTSAKQIVLQPADARFPDWHAVMPKAKPQTTLELDASENHNGLRDMTLGRIAVELGLQLNTPEEKPAGECIIAPNAKQEMCYINLAFLKPLLGDSWHTSIWGNNKTVLFEHGDGQSIRYTALVMPAQKG